MPRVSVILPTRNRAYCLARAIDSVLAQTFEDFELVVIDDASTDETPALLASYDDSRLRALSFDRRGGVSAARNAGILATRSELVSFQDSDDEWLPHKLARQVEVLDSLPADVGMVFCDHWRYQDGERFYYPAPDISAEDGIVFERALDDALHNIGTPILLVRREVFSRAGYFDERLGQFVDLDLCIRIAKHYRMQRIPEALMNVYRTTDSITTLSREG